MFEQQLQQESATIAFHAIVEGCEDSLSWVLEKGMVQWEGVAQDVLLVLQNNLLHWYEPGCETRVLNCVKRLIEAQPELEATFRGYLSRK